MKSLGRKLWFGVMVLAMAGSLAAQNPVPDYSKANAPLWNPIGNYSSRSVAKPNYTNTPLLDQVMKDGKITLSLEDAIALALENNLDLAIARYNLNIADTDILRSKSGSSLRGIATGIVQGTPGGTGTGVTGGAPTTGAQGAGAGGTTTAAGGAGAAGGIVASTLGTVGGPIPSFDPFVSSNLSIEHADFPSSNAFSSGVLAQNTGTANFSYNQGFVTGTNLSVGFQNQRQTSSQTITLLSPQINSNLRLTFTQHLLQGWGINNNRRLIVIARNNREISDVAFRLQVTTTVSQIEDIYWDLVSAYENVRVNEQAVEQAKRLLADNQKQVQIGTLAPIEVVRAQSQLATSNQSLIVARTNLQLQQLLMKNAISRNLTDPSLAEAEVIPTSTIQLPATEEIRPVQDLVADALAHRPELAESNIDLTNRDVSRKAARNELLPTVDLFAFYGTSALAGTQNPAFNGSRFGQSTAISPSGYGSALSSLFGADFPDKSVGINVQIPIRNRAAQADQVRSELEYRQAQMRLQQLQNQIRIEVRNAQYALQQNRAFYEATLAGRELAVQSLDAEQKKYALGASTPYNVMIQQTALTQAETTLVQAESAYAKSRVELDRATGLTLTNLGIDLADAETGAVKRLPLVPNIAPRTEIPPQPAPSPAPSSGPQGLTPPPAASQPNAPAPQPAP